MNRCSSTLSGLAMSLGPICFANRSRRMSEVLEQVGSGLLLVGFSALFVGGIGVFNSVRAYLDAKLVTIATLRALGARESRLAAVYGSAGLTSAVTSGTYRSRTVPDYVGGGHRWICVPRT